MRPLRQFLAEAGDEIGQLEFGYGEIAAHGHAPQGFQGLRVVLLDAGIAEPVAVDQAAFAPAAGIGLHRLAAPGGVEGGDDLRQNAPSAD